MFSLTQLVKSIYSMSKTQYNNNNSTKQQESKPLAYKNVNASSLQM